MQTRDAHLDFLRGCAIVLVAIGHYLQGAPDFDAGFAFHLIYAFHMPLFMVICGMTAARSLKPQFAPASAPSFSVFSALSLLPTKAVRLVLPFFAWAIVGYFLKDQAHLAFVAYLFEIVARPDLALWFLPVLFCVYVAMAISQFVYRVALTMTAERFALPVLAISILIGWLALIAMQKSFMLTLASFYFPFFCAGLLSASASHRKFSSFEWRALAVVATLVFSIALPFWHRTGVDPRLLDLVGPQYSTAIRAVVAVATAACGILSFLAIAREVRPFEGSRAHAVICYLGSHTLPIYAMHLFFLGVISNFLAVPFSIAASLGVAWLLRHSPWTRLLLLGEARRGGPSLLRFTAR